MNKRDLSPIFRRCMRRICSIFVISLLLMNATGCAMWNGGSAGEDSGWADRWRPRASGLKPSGLDSRAREIERNLGVR